jgi:hypothetical protein
MMTKLVYDYGTSKNAAAVRRTLKKLPPEVGSHIVSEQRRAKYREGYAAAKVLGIKAEFAVSEAGGPTIFFHSPVPLPVLAEMMEYPANHLRQIDPDGMVEFFGRDFEHFGAGLVDAQEESDVVGDLIEWNHRREDPTYDKSKVAISTKMEKYKNAKRMMVTSPHWSDGKPMPKLIYDYDSKDNNETVALFLIHPEIATKGDHIPEADADGTVTLLCRNNPDKPYRPIVADFDIRAAYREGYAAAKAFGVRVHLDTMLIATPPLPPGKTTPSIFKRYSEPNNGDTQLRVFFAGLIDGADNVSDNEIHYGMISQTAEKLAAYLKFRADREGSKSTLDEAFFANALNMGTRTFFGITVDPFAPVTPGRRLIEDKQNPAALAAWQAKEKFRTDHPLAAD